MKMLKAIHQLRVLCAVLVAVVFCVPAGAASVWRAAKIAYIYPQGNGGFILTFDSDAPTCTNVNTTKYYYIRVGANGVTQEGLENMLAVALAAATTDRAVTINSDDSADGCVIGRLIVPFGQ